jgi:hypothetical protein
VAFIVAVLEELGLQQLEEEAFRRILEVVACGTERAYKEGVAFQSALRL